MNMVNPDLFSSAIEEGRERLKEQLETWDNPLLKATKGEAYKCIFRLPSFVAMPRFEELPDIGLELIRHPKNDHFYCLQGTPTRAGKFAISFTCQSSEWPDDLINHLYFSNQLQRLRQTHTLALIIDTN